MNFICLYCAVRMTSLRIYAKISQVVVSSGRSCFDCVSIASCKAGLDFARKLQNGTLPLESRQTFLDAICGTDKRIPKVCCSDFTSRRRRESDMGPTESDPDPIENHRNIGLLPASCGDLEYSRLDTGEVASLYEFPWMTLIAYNTSNGLRFHCAGSIINSRYILTAANCVIQGDKLKNIAEVRVGDYDYYTEVDCQGDYEEMMCESKIQDLEVEEIIPHPRFTGRQPVEADIALLRVKKAISMTNNVAPVCLPVYSNLRNSELAGKNGTVAGWGLTDNQVYSSLLRKDYIPILTGDACNHYYNRYANQRTSIMETSFCAGTTMKDSCNGDSGGPLMVESEYNDSMRLVQFGIGSYGPMQCSSAFPGVYTDVTKYMEWILDNMRE